IYGGTTMKTNDKKKPTLTKYDLGQFTGSLERFETMIPSVIFTPGVKFLIERADALWLLDCISEAYITFHMMMAIAADPRLETLQFWRLDVKPDHSAVLTARADCDASPFIYQEIPDTDFPLESVEIWSGFDGRYWTLFLPSEY